MMAYSLVAIMFVGALIVLMSPMSERYRRSWLALILLGAGFGALAALAQDESANIFAPHLNLMRGLSVLMYGLAVVDRIQWARIYRMLSTWQRDRPRRS